MSHPAALRPTVRPGDGPRLLAPSPQRVEAPLVLRVEDLQPGEVVEITAEATDAAGRLFRSRAVFRSPDGVIDVARDAPRAGTYRGVQRDGLLTSMRARGGRGFRTGALTSYPVTFSVTGVDGAATATTVHRLLRDPEVTSRPVVLEVPDGPPLCVRVWTPPQARLGRPPVLLAAAPRTPLAELGPALLAARGYPTVTVALPSAPLRSAGRPLGGVPSDTVAAATAAARWLAETLDPQGAGIVLVGADQGADLALEVAAAPAPVARVAAVVAFSPSGLRWRDLTVAGQTGPDRRAVRRLAAATAAAALGRPRRYRTEVARIAHRLEEDHPVRIEVAGIPGDLLAVAARDDPAWPAAELLAQLRGRRGSRAGDRFLLVEGIGRPLGPARQPGQARPRWQDPGRPVAVEPWDQVLDLLRHHRVAGPGR